MYEEKKQCGRIRDDLTRHRISKALMEAYK